MFPCKQCGCCCRHIGKTYEGKDMALSNGICKYLDQVTNLCTIYEKRPIFCNVDAFYERYFFDKISREIFYQRNIKICSQLQRRCE